MSTIRTAIRRRHRGVLVLTVVAVLLALVPALVIGYRLNDANRSFSAEPTSVNVGQAQTVNGVTLSLESLNATATGTALHFSLMLPAFAVSSNESEVVGPMFLGNQVQLDGIAPLPSGLNFRLEPHHSGEAAARFTMLLGPVTAPAQPVTVTFMEIPLNGGSNVEVIQGPWVFVMAPEVIGTDQSLASRDITAAIEHAGVTVTVDRVDRRESGLYLYYSIASNRNEPIEPVNRLVRLTFNDRSFAHPTETRPLGQPDARILPGRAASFVSVFPPLDEPGVAVDVEFGPFVTGNGTPASLTIVDPFGAWSSHPITIDGDRLSVTDVIYEEQMLTIVVANLESVSEASAMFAGVGMTSAPILTDDNGTVYRADSGGTGLRKKADGSIGAGESGFNFTGVDPSASEVTLTVEGSGIVLHGPWSVELSLP